MLTRLAPAFLALALISAVAVPSRAAVTVQAYYRLGDIDPGAAPGKTGDDPTLDSTVNHLDLNRRGLPQYSSDVPTKLPTAATDSLSMFFDNNPISAGPGPVANDGYSRLLPVSLPSSNWGIEAWVKPAADGVTSATGYSLIAYNGRYYSNSSFGISDGIGLFQKGSNYVVRIGTSEKVLAPVVPGQWTHLVFIRGASSNEFFVNGVEEFDNSPDAQIAPIPATGYLAIGSFPSNLVTPAGGDAFSVATNGFYGDIDEVRFFTFSTIGPNAFNPSADLLYALPEPATLGAAALLLPLAMRRRR